MRFNQPRELARNLLRVNWDYNNFFFTPLADDCTSHATPHFHRDGLMLGVSFGGVLLLARKNTNLTYKMVFKEENGSF